jgi:hypothetical protein
MGTLRDGEEKLDVVEAILEKWRQERKTDLKEAN